MKKIYLAMPYVARNEDGSQNWDIMEERYHKVTILVGKLLGEGRAVFSPISHNHNIVKHCNLPRTHEFWLNYDKEFIDWCDEVWVFTLDGWKESKGVAWEIEYATKHNKQVKFIDEEGRITL